MIRPLRIAEIGRAASQGVRSHGSPGGIGQVRGGFHHDDEIVGAGDGEPKPIRPHAEAGIAGLHQGVPQHGRTTGKRRPPARGSRQVIDGCIVGTGKYNWTNAGSVTLEIDSRQVGAGKKRPELDAGDAVADRDAGQAGAELNACSPMLVTLLGILMLVRPVEPENA